MPVRKTAAKKTATPAKKTPAKKTVAKKSPSKPAAEPSEKSLADRIVAAIKDGTFDPYLTDLDNALTDRINRHIQEQAAAKKTATKTAAPAEKKVSAPPKKSKTIQPEAGVNYKAAARLKNLAGATVKFIRFKPDSDDQKSVVEMVTGVPGSPKGKRVVIPTAALEEIPTQEKKKPVRRKK